MKRKGGRKRGDACAAVCVYTRMYALGVKDENPLSWLTHPGWVFCNVDEPSRFKPVVDVFVDDIMTRRITISEHFGY